VSAKARGAAAGGRARRAAAAGRARRGALIAIACASLTAFFFAARFPYDHFRDPLVAVVGAASGAEVQVGALSGGLGLGGITLVAAPATLLWPAGARLELTRVALRPAWSLSWLWGRPALHLDLRAPAGRVSGTVWPGEPAAFEGGVRELALEQLPSEILAAAQGFAVTGLLEADAELSLTGGVLSGELSLDVRDGALAAPGSPISIPFERLEAALRIEPGGALRVESASLSGPMVEGTAQGQLGLAGDLDQAPLDVQLEFRVADPSLRGFLAPLGVKLDAEGRARMHLQGSLGTPVLR
jgi:type II secretion system protein N